MRTHRTCRSLYIPKSLMISIILLIVSFSTVWADNRKEDKFVLNLQQLIEMALAKSPEIKEGQSEIASAQSDLEQTKAGYYPQIESFALIGPVRDAKEPIIRENRIVDPSPSFSLSNVGIFGRIDFTATQPLYTFGKLSNRKEAATQGIRVKEYRLEEKKNEIVLKVKQLYYGLILACSGIEAADEAETFFQNARKSMKRLLELGSPNVIESDLYRVDAYRADTLRTQAEAEKGKRVAYFALKSMIQLPPQVEFELDQKVLLMKEETLEDLESYIQKSLTERPEFKQLEEALVAQQYQIRAAESDHYPSFFLVLEGSLAGAPGRESFHNAYIPDEFNHARAGVVAGVKWNFDFGIRKAKVDKERVEYERLLHTRASGKLNIPLQVAKTYQEVLEWKAAVKAYSHAATASRKWVVTALTNFDMSVGTADDMLKAIEKYGANQGKYLEALYYYNLSRAELEYAVGVKNR
jgi:outer membrane protein